MKSERAEEIKAGIMVLVGFVLFVGALVLMIGPNFRTATDEYTTLMNDTAGAEPGTDVRFGGLRVGQVVAVRLSPDNPTFLELRLAVAAGTPVRTDSKVRIASISMLGENHVAITTGSPEAALLPPGSELASLPYASMGAMLTQVQGVVEQVDTMFGIVNTQILTTDVAGLRERIGSMFDQITALLDNVTDVVSDENRENVAGALRAVRGTLEENRPDIRTAIANVRAVSAQLTVLADRVDAIATDAQPEIKAMLADLRQTAERASALAGHLDGLVVENTPGVNQMVDNLTATSANARDLTETLAQEPWRLIWRSQRPAKVAVKETP